MKSNQGVIKEFSVDDKGTVMVGALGLPPITGSNPSARACITAMKIMKGIEVRSRVEHMCSLDLLSGLDLPTFVFVCFSH